MLHRNTWGDALYLVLTDAPAAAACALDLQRAMASIDLESVELPADLALRLGGHLGPVFPTYDPVIETDGFMGSHVSRTARIEPITPPGAVYVTEAFAAALRRSGAYRDEERFDSGEPAVMSGGERIGGAGLWCGPAPCDTGRQLTTGGTMGERLDVVDERVRAMEDNVEQTAAWDGPLFDVWLRYRDLIESALRPIGEAALALHSPPAGGRCLDIGCGLGETTFRLAELVGPKGSARGIDVAPRMIAVARADLERAATGNVSFAIADVETDDLGGTYDYAFGRCGVMFFAHPVPAFRNVCRHLVPGSIINLIVWRRKIDNEWLHTSELAVEKYLDHPEASDVPTCGPGPFAMANADVITDQLRYGGFEDIRLARRDLLYRIGGNLDEAVEFNMALGPAAEILRQWGDRIDEIRPTIAADIREALSHFVTEDGSVRGPASVWVVSGRKPA